MTAAATPRDSYESPHRCAWTRADDDLRVCDARAVGHVDVIAGAEVIRFPVCGRHTDELARERNTSVAQPLRLVMRWA